VILHVALIVEGVLHDVWRPPGLHPAVDDALAAFDRAPLTTSIAKVTDAIGLSASDSSNGSQSRWA
jgi:hypothetical protein